MSALQISFALATAFATGCLAIHVLQEWSDLVTAALGWIFAAVAILVAAEALDNQMSRKLSERAWASSGVVRSIGAGIDQSQNSSDP